VKEQDFDLAAAFLSTSQAGRKNLGVVDYQDISRLQYIHHSRKTAVADAAPETVENKKPRLIPLLRWILGNKVFGQNIIIG
jgi:hypothetical protein